IRRQLQHHRQDRDSERIERVLNRGLVGGAAVVGEYVGVGTGPESIGVNASRLVPHERWHGLASRMCFGGTARGTLGRSIEPTTNRRKSVRGDTNLWPAGAPRQRQSACVPNGIGARTKSLMSAS